MEQEAQNEAKDAPQRVDELKERLERGEYAVDPGAVADAILRRAREMAMARRDHWWREAELPQGDEPEPPDQSACSYPVSATARPLASVNVTPPGSPSRLTTPIQVIRQLGFKLASALSTALCAAGGAQTQSS